MPGSASGGAVEVGRLTPALAASIPPGHSDRASGPAISDRLADSTASTAASSAACSAINITPARWLLSAAIAGCSDSWLQSPIPAAHIRPAGMARAAGARHAEAHRVLAPPPG